MGKIASQGEEKNIFGWHVKCLTGKEVFKYRNTC
jgi:hypothetical protein